MSYTKLFSSILTSTVWTEPDATRLVWITMLVMADRHGEVHSTVPGLAHTARVTLPDCEKAIETLLAPDTYSRTIGDDGRRIEAVEGGWIILNHAKFREMDTDADRKAKAAARQRRYHERKTMANKTSEVTKMTVHKASESSALTSTSRQKSQAETESETKASTPNGVVETQAPPATKDNKAKCTIIEARAFAVDIGLSESDGEHVWHGWEANGWKRGNVALRDWRAAMRSWKSGGYFPSQKLQQQRQGRPPAPHKGIQEDIEMP